MEEAVEAWLIWEDVAKEWPSQTLVNSLAKFAQGNREMWDEKQQEIIYAYNTAVQECTKHTPFEAMAELAACRLISVPSAAMTPT